MIDDVREKIERFRIKAESFLKTNTRAFIVDTNNTYYWCDILFVGEESITVEAFSGVFKDVKKRLYWADVIKFEEYRERE